MKIFVMKQIEARAVSALRGVRYPLMNFFRGCQMSSRRCIVVEISGPDRAQIIAVAVFVACNLLCDRSLEGYFAKRDMLRLDDEYGRVVNEVYAFLATCLVRIQDGGGGVRNITTFLESMMACVDNSTCGGSFAFRQ